MAPIHLLFINFCLQIFSTLLNHHLNANALQCAWGTAKTMPSLQWKVQSCSAGQNCVAYACVRSSGRQTAETTITMGCRPINYCLHASHTACIHEDGASLQMCDECNEKNFCNVHLVPPHSFNVFSLLHEAQKHTKAPRIANHGLLKARSGVQKQQQQHVQQQQTTTKVANNDRRLQQRVHASSATTPFPQYANLGQQLRQQPASAGSSGLLHAAAGHAVVNRKQQQPHRPRADGDGGARVVSNNFRPRASGSRNLQQATVGDASVLEALPQSATVSPKLAKPPIKCFLGTDADQETLTCYPGEVCANTLCDSDGDFVEVKWCAERDFCTLQNDLCRRFDRGISLNCSQCDTDLCNEKSLFALPLANHTTPPEGISAKINIISRIDDNEQRQQQQQEKMTRTTTKSVPLMMSNNGTSGQRNAMPNQQEVKLDDKMKEKERIMEEMKKKIDEIKEEKGIKKKNNEKEGKEAEEEKHNKTEVEKKKTEEKKEMGTAANSLIEFKMKKDEEEKEEKKKEGEEKKTEVEKEENGGEKEKEGKKEEQMSKGKEEKEKEDEKKQEEGERKSGEGEGTKKNVTMPSFGRRCVLGYGNRMRSVTCPMDSKCGVIACYVGAVVETLRVCAPRSATETFYERVCEDYDENAQLAGYKSCEGDLCNGPGIPQQQQTMSEDESVGVKCMVGTNNDLYNHSCAAGCATITCRVGSVKADQIVVVKTCGFPDVCNVAPNMLCQSFKNGKFVDCNHCSSGHYCNGGPPAATDDTSRDEKTTADKMEELFCMVGVGEKWSNRSCGAAGEGANARKCATLICALAEEKELVIKTCAPADPNNKYWKEGGIAHAECAKFNGTLIPNGGHGTTVCDGSGCNRATTTKRTNYASVLFEKLCLTAAFVIISVVSANCFIN